MPTHAPPTPTTARPRSTEALIGRYQQAGDVRARDEAVALLMPLVYSLCRRYENRAEWDDLVQVASLGLVKAIDRYDCARGVAISSFAVPTILGELRRYFRDKTWTVRPPRDLQERSLAVSKAIAELTTAHGRSPVAAVVAEHLGLPEEDVVEALIARRGYNADSLDTPLTSDDGQAATVADRLGHDDREFARAEARATLDSLLGALTERDREIVRMRFAEDLTQQQIADRVGLSQMQVSRILRAAVERLRAQADQADAPALR
jgi:RNA polymerase sigma-B factor